MAREFERDARRWIRHNRNLQGFNATFPYGGSDPGSPRLFAPWLADTVQPITPVPPPIRIQVVTDPAAGAEFVQRVPQGEMWRVISAAFTFVTDANAATRVNRITLTDLAGAQVWAGASLNGQAASSTRAYNCSHLGFDTGTLGGSVRSIGLHANFWMPQGFALESSTVLRQVGDQFSSIFIFFELWPASP